MKKRDTGPLFLFFWAHSKAVSLNFKNEEEGHRASFLVFWAHSEAVSLNTKTGAEGHRALVKHRDARAGERHSWWPMPPRPLKVNRARSPKRVLTPLSGILGARSVGKPAMKLWRRSPAADVDVAHRVVVGAARMERK